MDAAQHELDDDDERERRAFFRVLPRLPSQTRSVTAREAEALAVEIPERRAPDASRLDEGVAAWLDRIETKLDRILVHLGIGDPVVFGEDDVQEVLLSGSGMCFVSDEPAEPDALLRVEFELPGVPARVVRCLARVIRRLPPKEEGGPESTAVSFDVIHDGDREAIVQHAVEVQRALIRMRRPGTSAA